MAKLKVTIELETELVYTAMLEAGSRYWASDLQLSKNLTGCIIEHGDGLRITHHINPTTVQNGLRLLARDLPNVFARICSQNDDRNDRDCLLQLIVLGSERDRGHRDPCKYSD